MAEVQAQQSDMIMYFFKLSSEAKSNKIHVLGLQGATSGTNTRTLQTTPTKTVQIKGLGSANQQRVVEVIYTGDTVPGFKKNLYHVLKDAWNNKDTVHLWRCDFNQVKGAKGSRTVEAEYSQCLMSTFPLTEGLAAVLTSSLTLEVNGLAVDTDDDGNPSTLDETDCDDGAFDLATDERIYDFSHGDDVGDGTDPDNNIAAPTNVKAAPTDDGATITAD